MAAVAATAAVMVAVVSMAFFKIVHNKKIKSLTAFAGTHTRGLLRIIAHASAPLI